METLGQLALSHWEMGLCRCCDQEVVKLWTEPDLPALELRPSIEQSAWLMRARHPSYFKRTTALIEDLNKEVLQIDLRDCGGGVLAPIATTWKVDHLGTTYLAIAPALLLSSRTQTPLLIDVDLITRHPESHYDELQLAFKTFVDEVTPRSFGAGR